MKTFVILIIVARLLFDGPAYGQTMKEQTATPNTRVNQPQLESNAPRWADLLPGQQALLEKLADRFDTLPAKRRELLAKGSAQYLSLAPAQQKRLRAMVRKFRKMSTSEKREKCRLYANTRKQVPFFCEGFLSIK